MRISELESSLKQIREKWGDLQVNIASKLFSNDINKMDEYNITLIGLKEFIFPGSEKSLVFLVDKHSQDDKDVN